MITEGPNLKVKLVFEVIYLKKYNTTTEIRQLMLSYTFWFSIDKNFENRFKWYDGVLVFQNLFYKNILTGDVNFKEIYTRS